LSPEAGPGAVGYSVTEDLWALTDWFDCPRPSPGGPAPVAARPQARQRDPLSHVTTSVYDAAGRCISSSSSPVTATTFTYDSYRAEMKEPPSGEPEGRPGGQ